MELFIVFAIGLAVYFFIVKPRIIKRNEELTRKLAELEKMQEAEAKRKREEELLSNPRFQEDLKRFQSAYRWMTIAGEANEKIKRRPEIHLNRSYDGFSSFGVILIKRGYELWTPNLKAYYNGTNWPERKKALDDFAVNLFGCYAEKMKKLVSIEYLADDLIKLTNEGKYDADFIITYDYIVSFHSDDAFELFKRELIRTATIDQS